MVHKIGISAVAALFVISFSVCAKAETDMVANGLNADLTPLASEQNSEFYHADEDLGKVKLPEKPECSSPQNFMPEQDLNTANALVMIKINDKIAENDIMLCRQNRNVAQPVYLIIYPYADNYRVYVINLDKNSSDYRDVTFIFP